MGIFNEFTSIPGAPTGKDSLRIINGKHVKAYLTVHKFIDADTAQHVFFCPALDLSTYGETMEKAEEMFKSSIKTFFEEVFKLPSEKVKAELLKLGWKQDKFKNKEFSRLSVDVKGELQNFNALEDSLQTVQLVA